MFKYNPPYGNGKESVIEEQEEIPYVPTLQSTDGGSWPEVESASTFIYYKSLVK